MGYRFYFYSVPKKIVKEIEKCNTNREYISVCKNYGIEPEELDNEKPYVPTHKIGIEVHEFGKSIGEDFYDAVYESPENRPLFSSEELGKLYDDYGAVICSKSTFAAAIESYRKIILEYFEGLIQDGKTKNNPFENRTKEEKMQEAVKSKIDDWSCKWFSPYNMDEKSGSIVNSWLYEYEIFELVMRYKLFDWENDDLIFMGW